MPSADRRRVAAFEALLQRVCTQLTDELRKDEALRDPAAFQARVRDALYAQSVETSFTLSPADHPHIFPDFSLNEFGVEVKASRTDSWRSVANSVFESTRSLGIRHIYLVFGKMGGIPEARWAPYGDSIVHVRTSHVPRFEIQIGASEPLLARLGLNYDDFQALDLPEKMKHIRAYARGRLRAGERLWWLEDEPGDAHSLPLAARLYTSLSGEQKRRLRAESALLCPAVVKPSGSRGKYDDAALYILTYHGVLCTQARDLFSAGSVALRADPTRGGHYLARSLKDLQDDMIDAAHRLPDTLFEEYWGVSVPVGERIRGWLSRADELATDWRPSEVLFTRYPVGRLP